MVRIYLLYGANSDSWRLASQLDAATGPLVENYGDWCGGDTNARGRLEDLQRENSFGKLVQAFGDAALRDVRFGVFARLR